ncbi:hypothetical protein PCIT_a3865 [Pseudoalteromonas citrea]|uniref:Uncharacterized protein n=2 Tax=Pseudoalteromonas citrea TaxID=43655 RepID=A0AAD4AGF3_9GAMM|nr:hypothetical protein [Pseudoalteromonas citrea]KAF7767774.1 hypothetical protein PCIT_a3865 [Pseudoalteromonas citrea]
MKLKLNKKSVKKLSSDVKTMPAGMTPQVAGGQAGPDSSYPAPGRTINCYTGNRYGFCAQHGCVEP